MVSEKKKSKQGFYLIRNALKQGDERLNHMSAGGRFEFIDYSKDVLDNTPPIPFKLEPDLPPSTVIITAAKKHIQTWTTSQTRPVFTVSEKLRRRLSTSYAVPPIEKILEAVEVPMLTPHADEFLAGTPIFFKAEIALQSRQGSYLTFKELNIDSSNKKVLPSSSVVIMNADNIMDDRNMTYGCAVWLVFDNKRVLGSQYTGVGETRKLSPALIKLSKAHVIKAHHIGRWILMNRTDPIGKLGKACVHGDRIMLEQEWRFLSSSPNSEVSLYKTKSSIADAMDQSNDVDFFEPIEDCTWRIRLISQREMGITNLKARALLIARANTQLVKSMRERWRIKKDILGALSDKAKNETDREKLNKILKHKQSEQLEQEHIMQLFHRISLKGFKPSQRHYSTGYDSSDEDKEEDVNMGRISIEDNLKSESPDHSVKIRSSYLSPTKTRRRSLKLIEKDFPVDKMRDDYWRCAQKILVSTHAWAQLDTVMDKYYNGPDRKLKEHAAIVIQTFLRRRCKFSGMMKRRMHVLDTEYYLMLSMKKHWKKDFRKMRELEESDRRLSVMKEYKEPVDEEKGELSKAFSISSIPDFMTVDLSHVKTSRDSHTNTNSLRNSMVSIDSVDDNTLYRGSMSSFSVTEGGVITYKAAPFNSSSHTNHDKILEKLNDSTPISRPQTTSSIRSRPTTATPLNKTLSKMTLDEMINRPVASIDNDRLLQSLILTRTMTAPEPSKPVVRPQSALPTLKSHAQTICRLHPTHQDFSHSNSTKDQVEVEMEKYIIQDPKQEKREKRMKDNEFQRSQTVSKLIMSPSNPSGLPRDVFEGMQKKVGKNTGLLFLRIATKNLNFSSPNTQNKTPNETPSSSNLRHSFGRETEIGKDRQKVIRKKQ